MVLNVTHHSKVESGVELSNQNCIERTLQEVEKLQSQTYVIADSNGEILPSKGIARRYC